MIIFSPGRGNCSEGFDTGFQSRTKRTRPFYDVQMGPEFIRLAAVLCVLFPLSLTNV
jgi:hypothetical protein